MYPGQSESLFVACAQVEKHAWDDTKEFDDMHAALRKLGFTVTNGVDARIEFYQMILLVLEIGRSEWARGEIRTTHKVAARVRFPGS